MGQQLIEVVRANFTADGVEDIVPFKYCYATHKSLGFGGIRILTETSAGEKLKSVEPNDVQPFYNDLVFRHEWRLNFSFVDRFFAWVPDL